MKRFCLAAFILLSLSIGQVFAFDLDETIDDDIRKSYNSSKLVKDTNTEELDSLPPLPDKLKNEKKINTKNTTSSLNNVSVNRPKTNSSFTSPPVKTISAGNIKIPKGTSVNVVNSSKISDWQKAGTTVKFTSKTGINNKKFTIPANTVFTGEILESHQPQITCNGGLVVIRIRSMSYKGETVSINAYVTRANGKNIFFNDIKGQRTYLKTVWKKGNWGRSIFNRMLTLTVNLGGDGSTILLTPFPFLYGTLCLGLNTLTSPICAFFNKGGHVSIPAGSAFRIKLLDDAYID